MNYYSALQIKEKKLNKCCCFIYVPDPRSDDTKAKVIKI